jgi:hypothetical protein
MDRATRASRRAYLDWRHAHYGKRVYRSRLRAWLAILRIWLRERRRPDALEPYACRYASRFGDGKASEPHVHIGHGRWTPQARARRRLRRMFLYPFFRARRRAKVRLRAVTSLISSAE